MTITVRPQSSIRADLSVAIQPSSNGRHLVRHVQPQEPFFYLGDTAWALFQRLDEKEATFYLKNRAAKGFNVVMAVLIPEHGAFEFSNREDQFPFMPAENSSPTRFIPDLTKPNHQWFNFVDRIIEIAAGFGISIALVPTWGRWVNGGLHGPPVIFDHETAFSYCKFLGGRYPFHPFILGGDSNRYWNVTAIDNINHDNDLSNIKVVDFGSITEAMAAGLIAGESNAIRALDHDLQKQAQGYKTFITYHSTQGWLPSAPEASASAQFPNADWLSLDVVQSGHSDGQHPLKPHWMVDMWHARSSYIPIRKMYNTAKPDGTPRPVMDLEPHYENAHYWFTNSEPYWQAQDIRAGGWQAVSLIIGGADVQIFSGACGYTYGCNSIWQMHNRDSNKYPPVCTAEHSGFVGKENWFEELDLPGAFQSGLMRQICMSLPNYFTRIPDSSFILSETYDAADGSRAGDKLIQGMRGDGWAMVHLPYGGDVSVDVEKSLRTSREWKAWWIDPRTGGREVISSLKSESRIESFSSPSSGSLSDDWLLFIECVGGTNAWFGRAV